MVLKLIFLGIKVNIGLYLYTFSPEVRTYKLKTICTEINLERIYKVLTVIKSRETCGERR